MPYSFSIEEQFKSDIRESRKWYDKQQKGLGKKFYQDVKSSLDAIRKTPHFAVRYDDFRCLPLRKYPFMIHYAIDEEKKKVLIMACIHCSLNPSLHWIK